MRALCIADQERDKFQKVNLSNSIHMFCDSTASGQGRSRRCTPMTSTTRSTVFSGVGRRLEDITRYAELGGSCEAGAGLLRGGAFELTLAEAESGAT